MSTIKVTDATVEPVSLADAKVHLKETLADAGNDAYITSLITVARTEAESRLRRTLLQTTWLTTLDTFPDRIELPYPPLASVDWVKYVDATGVLQTLGPASYVVRTTETPGQVVLAYGASWPATRCQDGAVQVQYKAGYGTSAEKVPVPVVHWIKLAIAELYENRGAALPDGFADGLLTGLKLWSV